MIKYLIAGVVVAALVGRAGAEPDDKHLNVGVARAPAYKAPVYKAPVYKAPVYKESADGWSGFYGGLSLGARWANNDWRTSDIFPTFVGVVQTAGDHGAINSVAARMGAYAGYNWQFDPAWIAGIEIDFGWANNRKSASPMPGSPVVQAGLPAITALPISSVQETWDGSVRGRVGKLITPDTLLFATGGLAIQRVSLSASCGTFALTPTSAPWCAVARDETHSKTMMGWTVGGGVERKLWGNWLARIDYRYADFGTFNQHFFTAGAFGDDQFDAHVKVKTHTATVGIAYKF